MLRDYYYSEDRRVDSTVLCLKEAQNMTVRVPDLGVLAVFYLLCIGFT